MFAGVSSSKQPCPRRWKSSQEQEVSAGGKNWGKGCFFFFFKFCILVLAMKQESQMELIPATLLRGWPLLGQPKMLKCISFAGYKIEWLEFKATYISDLRSWR